MSIARGGLDAELLEARSQLGVPTGSPTTRRAWTVALVAVPVASILVAVVGGRVFNAGGWRLLSEFWAAAISPQLSASFLQLTLEATLTTLAYAVLGSLLSVMIGLAGALIAARSSWSSLNRPLRWIVVGGSRGVLSLPRGVHEIVWGLILINILGADPLVAILAIGVPYGAITAKVFAEILDESPQGPYEALRSVGTPRAPALLYGLLGLASRDMVSYAFYRFECSIRAAAILGLIGAGGLGYELSLSFRTLRYDEMWTLIYALIVLSGMADLWSSSLRRQMSGRGARNLRWLPKMSVLAWIGLCLATAFHLKIEISTLWAGKSVEGMGYIARGMWPPALPAESWTAVIKASLATLQMSVIATAIAASLGVIASLLIGLDPRHSARSRKILSALVRTVTKGLLLLFRAVPPPVWAFLLLFVLLPGVVPGALALGVYNFGILGRLMYEAAENLDPAPRMALRTAGASGASSFLYGVSPRLASRFVALSLYRWEVATRETVIVGLVGAGGLGRLLTESLAAFNFARVSGTLIALIVVTLFVDAVSAMAREAFR